LASVYYRLTGKKPGRWFHDQDGNPFLSFVRAALAPIDEWQRERVGHRKPRLLQGCEDDIRAALRALTLAPPLVKSTKGSKPYSL
jgi:hypothetical protein